MSPYGGVEGHGLPENESYRQLPATLDNKLRGIMFRGKHGPVVVLALLCMTVLSLALAAPKAVADRPADGSRDKDLRRAQKVVLDPQIETGERRDYGATRGPSRFDRAETQAGSTSSALPNSVGGRWAYPHHCARGSTPST